MQQQKRRNTITVATDLRVGGYLPLRDYALIGDGYTSALVGRDGAIDWLCLPDGASSPVFDRILDARDGGCFELQPEGSFDAVRRYRESTNVLETTFATESGKVRVTDAMLLGSEQRELVRVVDPAEGHVPMRWRFEPRYAFGRAEPHVPLELRTWDAGDGSFELTAGMRATFVLAAQPPTREEAERRLERTSAFWMDWAARAAYEGPWRPQVVRSALALKLLIFDPTGAILAAPTTSLPERIGGDRNWDYRFSWLRDGIYTMRALLSLGYRSEAEAFFRWQLDAIAPDLPEVKPLYCLDGSYDAREEELELPGYRNSSPVRIGNAATEQLPARRLRARARERRPAPGRDRVARQRGGAAARRARRLRRARMAPAGRRHLGGSRTSCTTSCSRRRCAGPRSTAPPPWRRRERFRAARRSGGARPTPCTSGSRAKAGARRRAATSARRT